MRNVLRRVAVGLAALALVVTPIPGADAAPTVRRVAGADRFDTAARLSAERFPNGAAVAYVVSGLDYPDALAAAPAATRDRGPVLLVRRDSVPASTGTELDRLQPQRVVVVGGPAAVSDAVVRAVGGTRIAGTDRYATAAAVADTFAPGVPTAYVATGEAFPDALAAGSAGGPVLLVRRDTVLAATRAALDRLRPQRVVVVGGPAAVSDAVVQSVNGTRVAGADRYGTAAALSAATFAPPQPTAYLATGLAFADALAAGAANRPLLLVPGDCVPASTKAELDRLNPPEAVILGGTQAVDRNVETLGSCPTIQTAAVKVTRVATLTQPTAFAVRPGDFTVYIGEKTGRVRAVRNGVVDPTAVLDLSGQVSTGSEQGLLGIVFSPDGSRLYVDYTDRLGDTQVVEYAVGATGIDTASRRTLFGVDQPFANHNGGHLAFGPDGLLYVGLGDGGGANDPQNNAQRTDTLLGKIVRLDPRATGAAAQPSIWVLGLRNPWRFSFDRANGDLWIGDVGQSRREEVDYRTAAQSAGSNFGWARLEGTLPVSGTPPPDAVPPILEYPTADPNCAVTGGYVYRGRAIVGLQGGYLYGDFCGGRLFVVRQDGGRIVEQRDLAITIPQLASFGEDLSGELWLLSLGGGVYRLDPG
jgi:putative cell wall-binding protein